MSGVYHEPKEYLFKNRDGHSGKTFGTDSEKSQHMIIECDEKLEVSLRESISEFSYYIVSGEGYFALDGDRQDVKVGDLILVSPGTTYTFGGKLKMLLINTPRWSKEQEEVFREG